MYIPLINSYVHLRRKNYDLSLKLHVLRACSFKKQTNKYKENK